ncbi:hypothetical protein PM082_004742 [Marasmius tenuissimus]|nr:hypothetical protein PM082_004742 [Marasmius tenuissimus]
MWNGWKYGTGKKMPNLARYQANLLAAFFKVPPETTLQILESLPRKDLQTMTLVCTEVSSLAQRLFSDTINISHGYDSHILSMMRLRNKAAPTSLFRRVKRDLAFSHDKAQQILLYCAEGKMDHIRELHLFSTKKNIDWDILYPEASALLWKFRSSLRAIKLQSLGCQFICRILGELNSFYSITTLVLHAPAFRSFDWGTTIRLPSVSSLSLIDMNPERQPSFNFYSVAERRLQTGPLTHLSIIGELGNLAVARIVGNYSDHELLELNLLDSRGPSNVTLPIPTPVTSIDSVVHFGIDLAWFAAYLDAPAPLVPFPKLETLSIQVSWEQYDTDDIFQNMTAQWDALAAVVPRWLAAKQFKVSLDLRDEFQIDTHALERFARERLGFEIGQSQAAPLPKVYEFTDLPGWGSSENWGSQ